MEQFEQYAFVLNLFGYDGPLPVRIADDVELNRSTPSQATAISEFLASYGRTSWLGPNLYDFEPIMPGLTGGIFFTPVPPTQRRFWVLNFSGDDMPIWRLATAAQLTRSELEIGATFNPRQGNAIKQLEPARVFHFWEQHRQPIIQPLVPDELRDAAFYRDAMENLAKVDGEAEQTVTRVYSDFARLSFGPKSGELVLLGHFALIEALITHDPRGSGDSLNHQLSTKMPLLMRRFSLPLQPTDYFTIADARKVWKKLYGIRSTIAHGGLVDIRPGALKELRDIETIFKFVRVALKQLLIYAIEDPQFVFDLKAC
jgi:hypothetical protein